jgi:hypothetical protein
VRYEIKMVIHWEINYMSQEASETLGLATGIHQDEMLSAEDN